MKNKYFYITCIFIVVIGFIFIYGLKNEDIGFSDVNYKKNIEKLHPTIEKRVGKYIKQQDFDIQEGLGLTGVINNTNIVSNKRIQELKNKRKDIKKGGSESMVRGLCLSYNNVEELVGSVHFNKLKSNISEYRDLVDNSELFNFYELPKLINGSCIDREGGYIDRLIIYLQSDFNDFNNLNIELTKIDLDKFVSQIRINDDDVDLSKLLDDNSYFEKVFFEDNLFNILSVYYPYYVMSRNNLKAYINNPIIADFEKVQQKKALFILDNDLKDFKIKGIKGFRDSILTMYSIDSKEGLIISLEKDFNDLLKLHENIDLVSLLIDNIKFKDFVLSKKYEVLLNDESKKILSSIVSNLMKFIILSDDYQDSIRESWSGKEFFDDQKLGEGLFRLIFIYILSL